MLKKNNSTKSADCNFKAKELFLFTAYPQYTHPAETIRETMVEHSNRATTATTTEIFSADTNKSYNTVELVFWLQH
jgi:hypothetical protein